jgi:hypothetical protein
VAASRRGRTRKTETEGCGVAVVNDGSKVDDDELEEEEGGDVLWVGNKAVARSEVRVEAAACSDSKAGDEEVACSRAGIEDGK